MDYNKVVRLDVSSGPMPFVESTKLSMYSADQRFQKWSSKSLHNCHNFNRATDSISGRAVSDLPMRKLPGVKLGNKFSGYLLVRVILADVVTNL